ncbi:hypothetical protein QEG98_40475 [Myxococcus sp. MxC21-1]|nr:hypothetical protein [Myxococcus sp. MxC21-1]WNZ62032.1 hypothetical protein QEG98_40475 [Myxococcus sp. MxC21-1]
MPELVEVREPSSKRRRSACAETSRAMASIGSTAAVPSPVFSTQAMPPVIKTSQSRPPTSGAMRSCTTSVVSSSRETRSCWPSRWMTSGQAMSRGATVMSMDRPLVPSVPEGTLRTRTVMRPVSAASAYSRSNASCRNGVKSELTTAAARSNSVDFPVPFSPSSTLRDGLKSNRVPGFTERNWWTWSHWSLSINRKTGSQDASASTRAARRHGPPGLPDGPALVHPREDLVGPEAGHRQRHAVARIDMDDVPLVRVIPTPGVEAQPMLAVERGEMHEATHRNPLRTGQDAQRGLPHDESIMRAPEELYLEWKRSAEPLRERLECLG